MATMRRGRKTTWALLIYTLVWGWLPVGLFYTGLGQTGTTQAMTWEVATFGLIYVAIGYLVLFWFRRRGCRVRP